MEETKELTGCINLKLQVEDLDTHNSTEMKISLFSEEPYKVRQNIVEAVEYMVKKMGYMEFKTSPMPKGSYICEETRGEN